MGGSQVCGVIRETGKMAKRPVRGDHAMDTSQMGPENTAWGRSIAGPSRAPAGTPSS